MEKPEVQFDEHALTAVRSACKDPDQDPLYGFVLAMAWGGQDSGNGRKAWEHQKALRSILYELRKSYFGRKQRYELFRTYPIRGLGPAFFTKLLYFFNPPDAPVCPIMDQWTAKSILLLTSTARNRFISFTNGNNGSICVDRRNTGLNYEVFCSAVDALAHECGISVEQAEERMFSVGGVSAGPWRQFVKEQWSQLELPPYDHDIAQAFVGAV